jgi:hypothetical protein
MGRGKFKGKPTGRRNFSTPEEIGNDSGPYYSLIRFGSVTPTRELCLLDLILWRGKLLFLSGLIAVS